MEAVSIGEEVRVGVAFDHRKAVPVWFYWANRYYKVTSVNYTWDTRQGSARLQHYAVTDGTNTYELCFNCRTLEWILERVYSG